MQIVHGIAQVRAAVSAWRREGLTVSFVPTMGNLHRGHQSLLDQAHKHAQRVVASVFVNPTQFGPSEDYTRYPRTLDADADALRASGCALLFAPSVEQMYPHSSDELVSIRVPRLEDILCGAFRPGHFAGVATVVTRLFNIVQPDVAVFGAKDYQQLMVVRRVVEDLALPVRIVVGETVREPDGLALSSRNQYLDSAQRKQATLLVRTLEAAAAQVSSGSAPRAVEVQARELLLQGGFRPDYVAVCRAADLVAYQDDDQSPGIVLAAAWLGNTRLIDNILI